jgi:hypothetical protein
MAINYGVDSSVLAGPTKNQVDTTFTLIPDPYDMLLEDVYKRVTTVQGIVDPPMGVFWDTNTIDLRDYLLSSMSEQSRSQLKTRIESLFDAELRYSVQVEVIRQIGGALAITLNIYPSTDATPIVMVLTADSNQVTYQRVS